MSRPWTAGWLAAALWCGCSDPPAARPADAGPDAPACTVPVTLGVGGRGPHFEALTEGAPVEVIVGYQGFIFLQTILELGDTPPGQALASFTMDLEGHEPYADNKRAEMIDGGDGAVYSTPLSLYFNDFPLQQVVGKRCTIAVSVSPHGCTGRFEVGVILVDEDPCIHTVDDPEYTGCHAVDGGMEPAVDAGVDAAVDAGAS